MIIIISQTAHNKHKNESQLFKVKSNVLLNGTYRCSKEIDLLYFATVRHFYAKRYAKMRHTLGGLDDLVEITRAADNTMDFYLGATDNIEGKI
jgi:hypothetical protein